MSVNLFITSGTPAAACVLAVLVSKQQIISSSVVKNFVLTPSNYFNRIFEINVEFKNANNLTLLSLLLFGSEKQTLNVNTKILNIQIWSFRSTFNMITSSNLDTYWCISFFWIISVSLSFFFLSGCFSLHRPKSVIHLHFNYLIIATVPIIRPRL